MIGNIIQTSLKRNNWNVEINKYKIELVVIMYTPLYITKEIKSADWVAELSVLSRLFSGICLKTFKFYFTALINALSCFVPKSIYFY